MNLKNYYQEIITYYPLIIKLKQLNYSHSEILEILYKEHQFKINSPHPSQYLTMAISKIKNNKINKEFEHYMILGGLPNHIKLEYEEFCVKIDNDCYLTHISKIVNKSYIVTRANIHQLGSINSCLIAKRVLKFHDLPDDELIHNFILDKNKWSVNNEQYELSADDLNAIKNIHYNILETFNNLVKELKLKRTFYKVIFNEKIKT